MARLVLCLLILLAPALTADRGKKHGREAGTAGAISFLPHEIRIISEYYRSGTSGLPPGLAKRGGNLSPGLEKHLRRNGQLPPGLQKKVEPFPTVLDARLHPLPPGYRRVVTSGWALLVHDVSNVIVDIIELSR